MWHSGFWFTVYVAVGLGSSASRAAEGRPPARVEEKERIVEASPPPAQPWVPAVVGKELLLREKVRTGELSRATVRLSNDHLVRVNSGSHLVILPSLIAGKPLGLELQKGEIYLHSRGLPTELGLRTPTVTGTPTGTEFRVLVAADGTTTFTMFDGEVDLANAHGTVHLANNEQAIAEPGRAPRKTAVIEARNTIQWCLYYPGVLHTPELALSATDDRILRKSIDAYEKGDLLGALDQWPGRYHASSSGGKLYRAMIVLGVGQVDEARRSLAGVAKDAPGRRAIEEMIDAVNYLPRKTDHEPATAGEWLARSYYEQSRARLEPALAAARKATAIAPESGYAWTRVAELLFSFGKTQDAAKALDRGIRLAPRNAQAHALRGFLLAAQNQIGKARESFDEAIALDGALGNAWLGRGLTSIRKGHEEEGRRDMQIAAALEPNRSILRSYLGKAFSQVGNKAKANLELERGQKLDPNDPTPWLYSAIQRKQENRYNEAVDDLEKSLALNDDRRVYRSQFLLDQDRAVRGTNLASIYEKNGMIEQSVREAVRAVNHDYGSAPAHLFLSNSYNALRDPTRILLRYEAATASELLLANLLSPVGGGSLSQFVSQQEYSKLFEKDGFGFGSTFEYRSDGQLHQTASQYGTFGNFSYSLDADYQYMRGTRPNNSFSSLDYTGTFKLQLSPWDSIFMLVQLGDIRSGDVRQYFDHQGISTTTAQVPDGAGGFLSQRVPNVANLTAHTHEDQDPGLVLFGWHHEWSPGNHTLLLLGRLGSDLEVSARQVNQLFVTRDVLTNLPPNAVPDVAPDGTALPHFTVLRDLAHTGRILNAATGPLDFTYRSKFEIYTAELQQIATLGMQTFVLGGRFQSGRFDTTVTLDNFSGDAIVLPYLDNPPSRQSVSVDFERLSLYLYDTWRVTPWLSITGGVSYDDMRYPDNFRSAPINGRENTLRKVSPKAGFIMQPWRGATLRGAYAEAISGTSFDESIRLEPSQVAGFLQSYRSITSESLIGDVAGSSYNFSGLSFEQKLPSRTYIGLQYERLAQNVDRTLGTFDDFQANYLPLGILPSSVAAKDRYREDSFTATVNQLVGDQWAFGMRYRHTRSQYNRDIPELAAAIAGAPIPAFADNLARASSTHDVSILDSVGLYALYNHPCGFFARAEADWYRQNNDSFVTNPVLNTTSRDSARSDFWQFNVLAGYRFHRNQCEVSCGVLNLTDRNYQLSPLNPYEELPRGRTFVVRCKLVF